MCYKEEEEEEEVRTSLSLLGKNSPCDATRDLWYLLSKTKADVPHLEKSWILFCQVLVPLLLD